MSDAHGPHGPPRVLLVGATGYVGRAALTALAGIEVQTVRSLASRGSAEPVGPNDVVINCAGYVGRDAARLDAVNVALAADVARAVAAVGGRLVHVSSAAVFDGLVGDMCEATPPRPASAYARSKWRGEQAVRNALPAACIVRPSKVIGGADPRERLHSLARHVDAGRPLPVPRRQRLWANFVPAADLGLLLRELAVCATPPPPVVHATATVRWEEFVELIERALGKPIARLPAPLVGASSALARILWRVPDDRRPRQAQRLLEIWDRQQLVDSQRRIGPDRLLAALIDIVARTR